MKFLNNLKISIKILGVLVMLGVATSALVVLSGFEMKSIDDQYSELTDHLAPAQVEFARSTRRIAGMGHRAYKSIASTDPQFIQESAQRVDQYFERAMTNLKRARDYDPKHAQEIDAFTKTYADIHRQMKEAIALGLQKNTEQALAAMAKADDQFEILSAQIDKMNNTFEGAMKTGHDKVSHEVATDIFMNYVIGFSSLLVCLALGAWIAVFGVSRPLRQLAERMGVLASGNLDVEIDGQSRGDEVGTMAKAVQVFKDNAIALRKSEAEAEEQRHRTEEERARSEAQKAEAARQVAQVVAGLGSGLERLSGGDLTYRVTDRWADEYVKIQQDFNGAIDKLQDTIANIIRSSSEVSNAAAEISSSTTDLSQRTEEQAASLEETSASMEQIAATVKKNAENAKHANELTQSARNVADEGGKVVAEVVSAMSRIEGSAQKISDIISVIDEIARQTNLLALNAAVEAARAGDAGRGFAVVASEVRGLAQRASQAAKDIADLIVNSSKEVQDGVTLVNKAGKSLDAILQSINSVANIVSEIANASSEQSAGIDQVNVALSQMDEVTQQNSALVEENAATAKTLEEQQAAMNERVGYFRVGGSAANEPLAAPPPARVQRQPAVRSVKANGARHRQKVQVRGNLALKAEPPADFQEF